MSSPNTVEQAYWAKVVQSPDGCWGWAGCLNGGGYGTVSYAGRTTGAHRFSYELHHGPIPDGMFVLHRCDNPPCTRPEHLFLGTAADNARDCAAKGRQNGAAKAHHGEDHGRAKLTLAQAREIRVRRAGLAGRRLRAPNRVADLAAEYGVTQGLISQVVAGRIWREEVMPNV